MINYRISSFRETFFVAIFVVFGLSAPPFSYRNLALIQGITPQGIGFPSKYSPAGGIAYAGWIKSAYQFGRNESPTIQLINHPRSGIFNLNGPAFRTTQNKANPAYVLQGPLAGRLLYGVGTGKIFDAPYKNELTSFWRDYHKKQFPQDSLSTKRIDDTITLVQRSIEESRAKDSVYVPSITTSILLGHQALKDQPFERIVDMYKELQALGVNDFTLARDQDAVFSDAQLESFKERLKNAGESQKKVELLFKNPELTAATEMFLLEHAAALPAAPVQGCFSYKKGVQGVPNCVETLLHELVNLIVFDPSTRSFNPQKMVPSVSCNPRALSFYQQHPQIDATGVNNARQEWFNLVSGLPDVAYNQMPEAYELMPHFSNLLAVLNAIFKTQASTLEALGRVLSGPGHAIRFSLKELTPNDTGICRVTIEGLPGDFEIHVSSFHGYITRSVGEPSSGSLFDSQLHAVLTVHPHQEGRHILLPLILKNNICASHYPGYPVQEAFMATYTNDDLHDPNKLSDAIDNLMRYVENKNVIREMVAFLEKMPLTDDYFLSKALSWAGKLKKLIPQDDIVHQRIDLFIDPIIKKQPIKALGWIFQTQIPIDRDYLVRFFEKYTDPTTDMLIEYGWDTSDLRTLEEMLLPSASQEYQVYQKQFTDKIEQLPDQLALFAIKNFLVSVIDKAPLDNPQLGVTFLESIEALLAYGNQRIKKITGKPWDMAPSHVTFRGSSIKQFNSFYTRIAWALEEKISSLASMEAGIVMLEKELCHLRKLLFSLDKESSFYGAFYLENIDRRNSHADTFIMTALLAEASALQSYDDLEKFIGCEPNFHYAWSKRIRIDADFRDTFIRGFEEKIKPLHDVHAASLRVKSKNPDHDSSKSDADTVFNNLNSLYHYALSYNRLYTIDSKKATNFFGNMLSSVIFKS